MKKLLTATIILLFFSCSNYVSKEIKSPDGKFFVITKVNRTDEDSKFYAEPIFEVYNSEKKLIGQIESNAGDFNKWQIGWFKNVLIMNSSDIGNRAWEITENKITEIKLTNEINSEANKLINK